MSGFATRVSIIILGMSNISILTLKCMNWQIYYSQIFSYVFCHVEYEKNSEKILNFKLQYIWAEKGFIPKTLYTQACRLHVVPFACGVYLAHG